VAADSGGGHRLELVVADYQLANSARTAAEQIAAKYKSASHNCGLRGMERSNTTWKNSAASR
jgi:hypothetical protein